MRLTTWNVNGIRNPFGYAPWNTHRTFPAMFDILQADIVVMQELKIQRKDLRDDMVLLDGWDCYFSLPKSKKGYSGVGIYTRNATCAPIKAEEGILGVLTPPTKDASYRDLSEDQSIGGYPTEKQIEDLGVDPLLLDSEGRCVCLEFPAFVLFGVYSPANSNGLRDDFRYGFICALDCRIRNLLAMGKNVVLTGDLNVSREEIDTASAIEDMRKEGITHDQYISTPNRRIFNQLIIGGDVVGEKDDGREDQVLWDVVREKHPDRKGMFTHWEQKINARPGNFGSRIDFVLASRHMGDWFHEADIQEGLMGSDHCPVYGVFKAVVGFSTASGSIKEHHLLDIMNPPGFFIEGKRQQEWSMKNVPAFSAKLLPEFDKRRSIKDMFKKPSLPKTASSTSIQQENKTVHDRPPSNGINGVNSTTVNAATDAPTPLEGDRTVPKSPVKSSATVSPPMKRKASDPASTKPAKRSKAAAQNAPRPNGAQGQKSLKGFFTAKSPVKSGPNENVTVTSPNNEGDPIATPHDSHTTRNSLFSTSPATTEVMTHGERTPPHTQTEQDTSPSSKPDPPPPPSPATSTNGFVHDPIEAKDKWTALMQKPFVPMCEHGEPCKSMLTKKKGENQGRSFWMCARPLGPSGQKERGSQWRCPTFIWCSEVGKEKG